MNNSALRIEWDDNDKRQVEEAKTHYRNARKENRLITSLDGEPIAHFKPTLLGFIVKETELKEDEFSVRVFDETGDRRLIWNMKNPDQVKEAAKLFDEYIKKGWRGYTVDDTGRTRLRIHKFDIDTQEVLFEEKSPTEIMADFTKAVKSEVKQAVMKTEKIANFVKSFKNTKLVPRTYPG